MVELRVQVPADDGVPVLTVQAVLRTALRAMSVHTVSGSEPSEGQGSVLAASIFWPAADVKLGASTKPARAKNQEAAL
jgi:hypothetical protein